MFTKKDISWFMLPPGNPPFKSTYCIAYNPLLVFVTETKMAQLRSSVFVGVNDEVMEYDVASGALLGRFTLNYADARVGQFFQITHFIAFFQLNLPACVARIIYSMSICISNFIVLSNHILRQDNALLI